MNLHLETDRLYLRPLLLSDSPFIFELLNSKGWIEFIGDRNIKNTESAKDYIHKIQSTKNYFYNIIELKENKTPIGVVTLLNRENQSYPDIGFAVLPDYEKKGYAFEAASNYINALRKNKINRIIAIAQSNNNRSIQLLLKLGLTYEKSYFDNNEHLNLYGLVL